MGGTGAPTGSTVYVAIASSAQAFAALASNGSISVWGNTAYGAATTTTSGFTLPPSDAGYISIASTERAFSAIKADGTIASWGDNAYGGGGSGTNVTARASSTFTYDIAANRRAFAAMRITAGLSASASAAITANSLGNYVSFAAGSPADIIIETRTAIYAAAAGVRAARKVQYIRSIINRITGYRHTIPSSSFTSFKTSLVSGGSYLTTALPVVIAYPFLLNNIWYLDLDMLPTDSSAYVTLELPIGFEVKTRIAGVEGRSLYFDGTNVYAAANANPVAVITNGSSLGFPTSASPTITFNRIATGSLVGLTNTAVITTPGIPTDVNATSGNAQVILSWTAPSDGGSVITGYEITYSPVGSIASPITVSDGAATSFTVTGLTNGTTYTFSIKAINFIGSSGSSSSVVAVPTIIVKSLVGVSGSGKYQVVGVYNGRIYISNNYGTSWTTASGTINSVVRNWAAISVSATGEYMSAVVNGSTIWTSSTFGRSWTARNSSRAWTAINISADGQVQVASVSGGQVYISVDYGVNWTPYGSSQNYSWVACAGNGAFIAACVANGLLYTTRANALFLTGLSTPYLLTSSITTTNLSTMSINTGSFVTETITATDQYLTDIAVNNNAIVTKLYNSDIYSIGQPAITSLGVNIAARSPAANYWKAIAISATGQYQIAISNTSSTAGTAVRSLDYGRTWTTITALTGDNTGNPSLNPGDDWISVAISATGQYQTVVPSSGQIRRSIDYGAGWEAVATDRIWRYVAMSATGEYQTAVHYSGAIWTSRDFGVTWTSNSSAGSTALNWYGVSVSASGQYQTAVEEGTGGSAGTIWRSTDFGVTWSNVTGSNTTATWRAVSMSDSGQFQVAVGTIVILRSVNYGASWMTVNLLTVGGGSITRSGNWTAVAMDSDGQCIVGCTSPAGRLMHRMTAV
jgi:hypothetical protein